MTGIMNLSSAPTNTSIESGDFSGGFIAYSYWGAGVLQPFPMPAGIAAGMTISSGATVSGSIVSAAIQQTVQHGGTAVDTNVEGGTQNVYGRASRSILKAGIFGDRIYYGGQQVLSCGVAVGTRVDAGDFQNVESGGTANFTVVAGGDVQEKVGNIVFLSLGGTQDITDGGFARGTILLGAGAEQYVYSGRADGTRIGSGANQTVYDSATDAVVLDGGSQYVAKGASVVGTVVMAGGVEAVSSGAVASGLIVSRGGEVVIDGGTLVDAHIAEGAIVLQETLSSGMSGSGAVVSAGFHQTVLSGATATDTTVLSGAVIVFGGGTVAGLTVSSGGFERVNSGVTISGVIVGNGVELDLSSGTKARAATVSNGGNVQVSGGTMIGATVAGTEDLFFGGIASKTTIASGGIQSVIGGGPVYGGETIGVTIEDGGTLVVGDGSTAAGVTVESGGVFSAGASYTIDEVTVESGGEIILFGRIGSGLTVEKGAIEAVGSGGFLFAYSGQVLSGVQVLSGGEVFYAGGSFAGLQISSGGAEVVEAGVLRNVDVGNGVDLVVSSGGRVNGVHVGSGGDITLNRGGKVAGLALGSGATETLGSGMHLDGVTVSSGTTVRVADGATLTNATVQSGALVIYAGGTISGLDLATGARVGVDTSFTVSSGTSNTGFTIYGYEDVVRGALVSRTVNSGGIALDRGRSIDTLLVHGSYEYVFAGGVARNTIVVGQISYRTRPGNPPFISHSELNVQSGGKAVGVAVAGGGFLQVSSGGTASRVNIKHGGTLVLAGGTVTGLNLGDGGTVELTNGSVLSGAVISGNRTLIVDDFGFSVGSAVDAVVRQGGTIIDKGGIVSGLKLESGGTEILSSGSVVGGATIVSGAQIIVSAGATIGDTKVLGGTETVLSGGTVLGTVTFGKDGDFAIAGAPVGLRVSGFRAGDHLGLSSFQYTAGEKLSFAESADKTKGVLTVKDATMKATIALFGQYVAAGFHLASDGAGGTVITYPAISAATVALTGHH
jgi:autotransporter passenger strand-loop-strand repeat protein